MRKNENNTLKKSLIYVRNSLNIQEMEKINQKSSRSFNEKNTSKKEREDKVLNNAYKNVINVLNNLLENIEDEKINGKVNNLGSHRKIQCVDKKPVKKLVSLDLRTSKKYNLNVSPKYGKNGEKMQKKNAKLKSKFVGEKLYNSQSQKQLFIMDDNNLKDKNNSDIEQNDKCSCLFNNKNGNKKNLKKKEITFFKPKNKLVSRWNSSKNVMTSDYSSNKTNNKEILFNKDEINESIKFSSAFSSFINSKKNLDNKKNSKKNFFSSIFGDHSQSNNQNKILESTDSIQTTNILESQKKYNIQEILANNNINYTENENTPHLFERKNSENSIESIKQNNRNLLNIKKKIKKLPSTNSSNFKNSISLKSFKGNLMKTINKEKKYRYLLNKGCVYDSLDDEEDFDEEDINNCYFEPNSQFLYIIDSLILVSSIIIIFYLPIYLSKQLFFCRNLSINTILFYFIDIIYILDLIINFYRAYYNFEEILIKKNYLIFIHYFKTWFFFDLISSVPIFTILKAKESKCMGLNIYDDPNLDNSGKHSHYYNIDINRIHYLLLLLKAIKILKIFKKNIAAKKIKKYIYEYEFFNDWGDVIIYGLIFFSFLNFSSCIFIFIGRNIYESWIFFDGLSTRPFTDIYIASIYYLMMTVTTVGYGDVIGKSIREIIFQIIMVIIGTCIYSWLISTVSNYVKKMNEKDIIYEEKIQILEDIKLNSPNLSEKLYNKILKLLNYRKYHEEEIGKNIILENLPNSLKHTLIIDMYKNYINGFSFFKGIENREFIVKVISKLTPIFGSRGDILIQEGEHIEEIIFIKNGILSLEVWIDMINPEESIEKYLYDNGFISQKEKKESVHKENSSAHHRSSIISIFGQNKKNLNISFNNYFEKIENKNEIAINDNKSILKILDIRRNEHFGDVFMFLNKKSPLYVRVASKNVDLLLLKKLDSIDISDRFPDVWKTIIKRPLENSKMIANLTLKSLSIFCNLNGIKTKLFKKKKDNKYFPSYYLIPTINKKGEISPKTKKKKKTIKFLLSNKNEKYKSRNNKKRKSNITKDNDNDETFNSIKKVPPKNILKNQTKESDNKNKLNNSNHSSFSFKNSNKNILKNMDDNDECSDKNKKLNKSAFHNNKNNSFRIVVTNAEEKEATILKNENIINNSNILENSILTNNKINDDKIYENNNSNDNIVKDFTFEPINDELLPGENFNIQVPEDDRPKNSISNIQKIISDKIYINQLNIIGMDCLKVPLIQQNNNININGKIEKKIFSNLEISSSVSTLEISSSYENINEITYNKYIANNDLRNETIKFLKVKCQIMQNNFIHSFNIVPNKDKDSNIINKNSKIFSKSSLMNTISRTATKRINEKKDNSSILSRQSFLNKSINTMNENKNDAINDFQRLVSNSFYNIKYKRTNSSSSLGVNKINDMIQKEGSSIKRSETISNMNKLEFKNHKKKNNIIPNKKKKKLKELDIISSNILKSSQNLNNPQAFYAGLFSQIMFKNYTKLNPSTIQSNIDIKKKDEQSKNETKVNFSFNSSEDKI